MCDKYSTPFKSVVYTMLPSKGDFIQLSLIFIIKSEGFLIKLFITMVLQPKSKSSKSDVFPYKCTRPTFVLVRRLYQSDVCTSPTFVLVRRLYWSDVCKSDVCTVRRLWRPTFVRPTFVLVPKFLTNLNLSSSNIMKSVL